MYNWKCEKQQVKIEKDCLFHEILKVPAEIEPLGKFEVNDECCLEQNLNEPFESIKLEDILSVNGKNPEESKPPITYIESHLKYDKEDSDKIADMQEKPIMNLLNNGKVNIKDEYDFRETEKIKTEYNIDLKYEYVKSEIVGQEWNEHSQETKSKDRIFIERNKSSQEIISRSPTTDSGSRIQQTNVIEGNEIDVKRNKKSKQEIQKRTRTKDKAFQCTLCSKSFAAKGNLRVHQRSHTGEKPFECSVCSDKFSVQSALKTHERIHSGEKPFSCKICSKLFRQKATLIVHEKTHLVEKPFQCKMCPKLFCQKANLEIEMRKLIQGTNNFIAKFVQNRFIERILLWYMREFIPGKNHFTAIFVQNHLLKNTLVHDMREFIQGKNYFNAKFVLNPCLPNNA